MSLNIELNIWIEPGISSRLHDKCLMSSKWECAKKDRYFKTLRYVEINIIDYYIIIIIGSFAPFENLG